MVDLEALGISKEDLQDRVVEAVTKEVLCKRYMDEDGWDSWDGSPFAQQLNKHVKERIDEKVAALAEAHILPNVSEYIENLTLQKTTEWGAKTGEPVTFIEYLIARAEKYLREKVNYEGKSADECRGYSFSGTQTRIAHMVDKHLHYSIDRAMKDAVKTANDSIAKGIEETVKIKLAEIVNGLETTVKVTR